MLDFFEFECGCKWPIIEKNSDPEILPKLDIDPENLPDCYLTWKMIGRGDTKGVFQLESRLGQTWAKKLRPENMEHMSALGALLRPGALQNRDENGVSTTEHYCLRKNKEEFASSIHDVVDKVLEPTENLLVYQEQSMLLGKYISGFDLKNVDRLRKCIGKKDMKEMHEVKKLFLEGAKATDAVPYEMAEMLWSWIEKSGRYAFNKCLDENTLVKVYGLFTYKRIKNVKIGDRIKTKEGYVSVLDVINNGPKQVVNISTSLGKTLTCTKDHKIDCEDDIQRTVEQLMSITDNRPKIACDGDYDLGSDYEEIVDCVEVGVVNTMDLEVDNKSHTFYANGISVSNSHSVSYGAIGYDTAYLKIHFPLQFFTEWLRLSADKIEPDIEKMELIEEAKKFDIKVNPPKIEYKQYLFEHNGKEIFFGLTDIKGVGESNLEKLFKSVDEAAIDVKTAKWVDWLYRIVPKNYAVMQKMIMAGCFDSFKIKRQRMLAEIAVVNELTDKEIKWMMANSLDVSFIDGLRLLSQEKPKGGCANIKRRAAVQSHADMLQNPPSPQNDSIPWLVWAEVQTLGLAVTVSKVEAFTLEDVNTTCKDFQTGKTGMLIFGIEVKDFREVKTKKGKQAGKEMAFMSISDPSGTIDNVICFPETWQNYKHLVIKGNTILLKGERDRENNGLIVQTISQLV